MPLFLIYYVFLAASVDPERRSGDGVLYRDGHYYKKDRRDKVSLPISCSSSKTNRATGKPHKHTEMDLERSAMGKPNLNITNLDGANNGTVDNSLDKAKIIISHQGGAGNGEGREGESPAP